MSNAFNTELRAQQEWSWLLAIWLFLGGSGSGLFLLFVAFELPPYDAAVSLALIATGATNREIAGSLHLSPHTVKEHTSALYRKLGARNRAEAVQLAQRIGLLA